MNTEQNRSVKLGDMPSYGGATGNDMLAAVSEALFGHRDQTFETEDQAIALGHQMVPAINFNSLNRIVTAFVNGSAHSPATAGVTGIRNPFKIKLLANQFRACVACYFTRHKDLFRDNGARHMGNGVANKFWLGFDHAWPASKWDAASKQSAAYAAYKAGEAVAHYEAAILSAITPGTKDDRCDRSAISEQPRERIAVTQWQPIETAPRDGTRVDLWGTNHLHPAKTGRRAADVTWGRVRDWMGNERDDWQHGHGEDFEPTHWMPLPAPPSITPVGKEEGNV